MGNPRKIKLNQIWIATNMIGRPVFACSSVNNFSRKILNYEKENGFCDLNLWHMVDGRPELTKPVYKDYFVDGDKII